MTQLQSAPPETTTRSVPEALRTRIDQFTACLWETASLEREDIQEIRANSAVHGEEPMTLTSCQRLEVYNAEGCDCAAPVRLQGLEALQHLAEVAAGLHSVVLGEAQILGQVRTSLNEAPADVRALGDVALAAARELRRDTEFNSHSGHLLDRAMARAGIDASGSLLVIGAGAVGRLVAERGRELGFKRVVVAGRRYPEGDWFAGGGFEYVHLAEMAQLDEMAIAVGCLGSEAAQLDPMTQLPAVSRLLVDLGTPRNFADRATTPVVTIAALLGPEAQTPHSDARRRQLRERLYDILDRRLQAAARDSQSPVGTLRKSVEQARKREVERIRKMHPEIPEETVEAITRSLLNRVFHAPSERLKHIDDPEMAQQVVDLFAVHLGRETHDGDDENT
ncbi:MAG: hypothetical protein U5Q44_16260 [Dehalococcoidia bacterium]|nr:hypothetical protein [Dehalococcoidia bacterium]